MAQVFTAVRATTVDVLATVTNATRVINGAAEALATSTESLNEFAHAGNIAARDFRLDVEAKSKRKAAQAANREDALAAVEDMEFLMDIKRRIGTDPERVALYHEALSTYRGGDNKPLESLNEQPLKMTK